MGSRLRRQVTAKPVKIQKFAQQLNELPERVWNAFIEEIRQENLLDKMTKEELKMIVNEMKRRRENLVPVVLRQKPTIEEENSFATRCPEE